MKKIIKNKDYKIIEDRLILNCPFCKKKMWVDQWHYKLYQGKLTVGGLFGEYVECCKNFWIDDDKVIEV